jgi:hypothetical protein
MAAGDCSLQASLSRCASRQRWAAGKQRIGFSSSFYERLYFEIDHDPQIPYHPSRNHTGKRKWDNIRDPPQPAKHPTPFLQARPRQMMLSTIGQGRRRFHGHISLEVGGSPYVLLQQVLTRSILACRREQPAWSTHLVSATIRFPENQARQRGCQIFDPFPHEG